FSIEWSRIEPEEGKFDADAIDYYRRLLWACRQRNLEPFVTLWHWTLPLWFAKLGGFEKENNLFYFERFVKRVVENFGSQVNFWITLNEPEIYATIAYFLGFFPPQKKSFLAAVRVFHNLIKVHREIYKIIHQIFPGASVGIAKNNSYFEAVGGKFINKSFKKAADYFWNDYFLNKIKGRTDFIGLNYYFHNRIDFDWRHLRTSFSQNKNESVSDMGWEIYPEGIYYVLKDLKKYNKPIYITENGLADTKDEKRAKFIKDHLRWTHKAIQEGVDARGYFHWSLLDNFEWDKGFWPRFGLVEVDWQTLERRKRPSADFYASIAKNNGLD
ncbi:MAG: family 1 glycosylhydrolase, partial [bacterium]|nr:family 1 glycosylhydrolase [bacterium]